MAELGFPPPLAFEDYREEVQLHQAFMPLTIPRPDELGKLLDQLVAELRTETLALTSGGEAPIPRFQSARQELRALLTRRGPKALPESHQAVVDQLLQEQRRNHGCTDASSLPRMSECKTTATYSHAEQCALWRGDITTLAADAIVNAANSELLGCFLPFHACIDNAIHWAAGPRLRHDCSRIMHLQGRSEPAGKAKATRGYNLPSRFVLHTVGPIVNGPLTEKHEHTLADCYRACLDLAVRLPAVRSVAFCAISTGVFGYPKLAAARVALRTVAHWLNDHPNQLVLVVFNVFSEDDHSSYEQALVEGNGFP